MALIRCPFCHKAVLEAEYAAHVAVHATLRPDGQQTDYVTLPESARESGDLAGVPRVYVHRVCGVATEMPEEIVRSYLVDPFLYSADQTFCCGCGGHVPFRECVWTETGEDLQTYTDALRAAHRSKGPWKYWGAVGALIVGAFGIGMVLWALREAGLR